MLAAIRRPKPDKAPGPDGITNRILQKGAETIAKLLTPVFQACAVQGYHPRAYKDAHTITLKTRQKDDYTTPKAWSPIALLNTTGKVFESVMAAKMSYLTERHRLIPDTQMGGRGGKSTETARELLTEQVHTVWGQGQDRVATILSIDVAGAFDTVSHRRLLHNLKKRKIPGWMAKWVGSFLEDRHTTLAINHRATESFKVTTGIPQGSPISPILYLYYNADLLDICERPGEPTSAFGFIVDINRREHRSTRKIAQQM